MQRAISIELVFDERFQEAVQVELSPSLTVFVGPNGSGKSTVLESIAEVFSFLGRYFIEGPASEVRKALKTQRSTKPKWTRATVTLALDEDQQRSIDTIGIRRSDVPDGSPSAVTLTVVRREHPEGERWIVGAWSGYVGPVTLDTSGAIIVDSARRGEAVKELTDLNSQRQSLQAKVTQAQAEYNGAAQQKPQNHDQLRNIQGRVQQHTRELQESEPKFVSKTKALEEEIEAGARAAVRLEGGGEIAKAKLEATHKTLRIPQVQFLHGAGDFEQLVKRMTKRLRDYHVLRRSERSDSEYQRMKARLEDLLRMDVAVESHDENGVLLIDDRPIGEVSFGTWLALAFASISELSPENSLIVWDEPETGLHPTWAAKVCDLMRKGKHRFLIGTHRTEMAPIGDDASRIYKTLARPPEVGAKSVCSVKRVTGIVDAFSVCASLGVEPARLLFTTNAVIWVEGPSDVMYWRFWLHHAATSVEETLIEGCDYSFMFSGGSLLANQTFAEQAAPRSGVVNLLNLVGASLVIVDTDFNPDDKEPRVTRREIADLVAGDRWEGLGFVFNECQDHLKPRVRELLEAVKEIGRKDNLSQAMSTWGRETENAITDDAFRRTLRGIYQVSETSAEGQAVGTLTVDPWLSYDIHISQHLQQFVGSPNHTRLWFEGKEKKELAQRSIIGDKVRFAQEYTALHKKEGMASLRPEAQKLVSAVLNWILLVRKAYRQ